MRVGGAVAQLTHPNIVTVIDRGEQEGRQFIVFEYIDGENLKELTNRGPLDVHEAAVDVQAHDVGGAQQVVEIHAGRPELLLAATEDRLHQVRGQAEDREHPDADRDGAEHADDVVDAIEDLRPEVLAERIRTVVGYSGRLEFDASRPDGMPLKSLDAAALAAGIAALLLPNGHRTWANTADAHLLAAMVPDIAHRDVFVCGPSATTTPGWSGGRSAGRS